MPDEQTIFRGNPSPATVFGSLLLSTILFLAVVIGVIFFWHTLPASSLRYLVLFLPVIPVLIVAPRLVALKFIIYEITTERVRFTRGILSKRTDELELYRVKDTSLLEPFFLRLFSVGNILLVTKIAARGTKCEGRIETRLEGTFRPKMQLRRSVLFVERYAFFKTRSVGAA